MHGATIQWKSEGQVLVRTCTSQAHRPFHAVNQRPFILTLAREVAGHRFTHQRTLHAHK